MDSNKIITKSINPISNTERYIAWIGEFHRRLAQGNVELMGETAEVIVTPKRVETEYETAVIIGPDTNTISRFLRKRGVA